MTEARPPSITLICAATTPGDDEVAATRASVGAQTVAGVDFRVADSYEAAAELAGSARGWVGFLDPGDLLAPGALAVILDTIDRDAIRGDPAPDLVYTDETSGPPGGARTPFFKPAWSPDRLRCQPYTGRLTLARAELVAEVGGLRAELGSCAEHDLMLRLAERVRRVVHVPETLCHRLSSSLPYPGFDPADLSRAIDVVDDHLRRTGFPAVAEAHATAAGLLRLAPRLTTRPEVSIVIPTAGTRRRVRGADTNLVVNCVRSLLERSTYEALEIACVVDDSVADSTRDELRAIGGERIRLVEFDGPFHFSRKVNRGVLASTGDVLVILNDDTDILTPGWLEAMLMYALDPAIGAVGARLLFEDGRIQHAGVVGVRGNPGHPYHGLPADTVGHGANALVPGDFLAVTAACLMTRREVFEEVGGMSPWFPANYNDLDYCLKLGRAGYRVVATPDAVLEHFESSSRSGDVATHELELIRHRWGRWLRDDPFYGPNFPSGVADFVPALSSP